MLRNEFYKLATYQKRFLTEDYNYEQLKAQDNLLESYLKQEEKAELFAMISMLPIKYREIMMNSIYLGISDEMIAKQNGLRECSVRQIRSRAKTMLLKMKEKKV